MKRGTKSGNRGTMAAFACLLCLAGCSGAGGQKEEMLPGLTSEIITPITGQSEAMKQENQPSVSTTDSIGTTGKDDTKQTAVWAQSGVVLSDGVTVEGSFEKSRSRIELHCRAVDGGNMLSVDGTDTLLVSQEQTAMLYDINEEDAFLELVVGEKVMLDREAVSGEENDSTAETEEFWKLKAYQVLPGGLQEILLLPEGKDGYFYIKDWYQLSFRKGCTELYRYTADGTLAAEIRELMPEEGYLVSYHEKQAVILVDGEALTLPAAQMAVCGENGLGVAFSAVEAMAGTVYYNIYRSMDGGETWSISAKNAAMTSGSLEHIHFPGGDTVLCCFDISGISEQHWSYLVSEDGGVTWKDAKEVDWMKKYPSVWERE